MTEPRGRAGVAVVTGGAKGIGLAISRELARRGHHVVIAGRDAAALADAVGRLTAEMTAAAVSAVQLDVTDTNSVTAAFTAAAELGPVTVLINNAGVIARQPAATLSDEDWIRVIETDLGGIFRCCRAVFPLFQRSDRGAVVNVASIGAVVGISGRVAYTAAKAGVQGLTRTLALEWAPLGFRVNTVAPGWTRTEMVAAGIATGQLDDAALRARIPLGRLAEPSEIADAVAYLASPSASYITGATLLVDGGITVNGNA